MRMYTVIYYKALYRNKLNTIERVEDSFHAKIKNNQVQ